MITTPQKLQVIEMEKFIFNPNTIMQFIANGSKLDNIDLENLMQYTPKNSSPDDLEWEDDTYSDIKNDPQYIGALNEGIIK